MQLMRKAADTYSFMILHPPQAHSFVLTPHMTEPLPNDGKHPQDIHVLASGTYNLGFLGISKTTTALKMLDWWNDKLFAQASGQDLGIDAGCMILLHQQQAVMQFKSLLTTALQVSRAQQQAGIQAVSVCPQ